MVLCPGIPKNHPPLAPPIKGGETLSSLPRWEGLREGETIFVIMLMFLRDTTKAVKLSTGRPRKERGQK